MLSRLTPIAFASLLIATGCARGDARELLEDLEDQDYQSTFPRAPGWPDRMPNLGGPHGDYMDIFVNETLREGWAKADRDGEALDAWPDGSIIVKDAYRDEAGTDLRHVLLMEKRGDDWFWAEFDGGGKVLYAGKNNPICTKCHKAGDDQVLAFPLPRGE